MTPDDMTLVREFATGQSELAFAALVERHIGLVHSVALRQTGDPHLAEDITQAVFIILARKAASLGGKTVLAAWLYRATYYAAADALKLQRRRRAREQEAYMQSTLQSDDNAKAWEQLAPLLDDAMVGLSERDRVPLVLRYFENRPWREVAATMQLSEDAAQKRAARALEKLRTRLIKRGVTLSAALIGGAVSANSVHAMPAGLAKAAIAVSVTKGSAATASTLALVKVTTQGMVKTTGLKIMTAGVILANLAVPQQTVASHFDFRGRPDYWMTRPEFLLCTVLVGIGFPMFFVVVGYAVRFLPVNRFAFKIPNREFWLAPDNRDEMFDCIFRNYLWIACFAAIYMLIIQWLVVYANHQIPPRFPTGMAFFSGGCFIAAVLFRVSRMMRYFKQV